MKIAPQLFQLCPGVLVSAHSEETAEDQEANRASSHMKNGHPRAQADDRRQDSRSKESEESPFLPLKECDGEDNVGDAYDDKCGERPSWSVRHAPVHYSAGIQQGC